jgi:hypothetical protein
MVGPNGCGKTTLALSLLERRAYVTAFGTKPRDRTLQSLVNSGWKRIGRWSERDRPTPRADGTIADQRYVLWPRVRSIDDIDRQGPVFAEALDQMFLAESWCCFADEVYHLNKNLRLTRQLRAWWMQGRSIKLSLVAATQRPAWVPIELYTESQHLFLWATNDKRDLDRMRDIAGPFRGSEVADIVAGLDFKAHEVLYVNVRTGQHVVTIPPEMK